jgi:guanosine-3',5'-bis(diphosphate) 3'-pyrophosphohydrolase
VLQRAELFAKDKHQGQLRADKKTPYYSHLSQVVTELKKMGVVDNDILCAGWLHDTIEDTDTDYDKIMKEFNETIANYVASVTKDTRLVKVQQERQYVTQLEKAPWQSKVVKLADIIANFKDLANSGYPKQTQDSKVKGKIPYIMAIKSELVTQPETPHIKSALETLNELLEKHNQDPIYSI